MKNHIKAGDERFTVYAHAFPLQGSNTAGRAAMAYAFYPKTSGIRGAAYMIPASEIDNIFLERFIYRLQHTQGFDDYIDYESADQAAQMQLQQDIERDIKVVKSLIAKLKRRLTLLTVEEENENKDEKVTDIPTAEKDDEEDELVREVKHAYKAHKAELKRLEARKKEVETSFNLVETRRTYKQLMHDAGEAWVEVVTPEEIPLMIDTFVKGVVLTMLSPRFYKLTIHWYDPEWGIDERVCFKGGNPSLHWKAEEDAILISNYPSATREELMRLLPARSYTAMKNRANTLRIKRAIIEKGEQLTWTFCLQDLVIMDQYGLTEEQLRQKEGANLLTWSAS